MLCCVSRKASGSSNNNNNNNKNKKSEENNEKSILRIDQTSSSSGFSSSSFESTDNFDSSTTSGLTSSPASSSNTSGFLSSSMIQQFVNSSSDTFSIDSQIPCHFDESGNFFANNIKVIHTAGVDSEDMEFSPTPKIFETFSTPPKRDQFIEKSNCGDSSAEPEDSIRDEATELLPCAICARTFKPLSLEKHTKICERSAMKKRKPFDSAKQRIQGTELAEFLPKEITKKKIPHPEEKIIDGTNNKGSWKQSRDEFLRAIRAARGETQNEVTPHRQQTSSNNVTIGAPTRPNEKGLCPTCNRQFSIKSYERHVAWCKERATRLPVNAATNIAKERLEARMKYRAPALKNRRLTNREKYSPVSAVNLTNLGGKSIISGNSTSHRPKETASTPNYNNGGNDNATKNSQMKKSTTNARRSGQSREGISSGPMKSRLSDRSNRPPAEIDTGTTTSASLPRQNSSRINNNAIVRSSRVSPTRGNLTSRSLRTSDASSNCIEEKDENGEKKNEITDRGSVRNRPYRRNIVRARSNGNPRLNDTTINEDVIGMTVQPCGKKNNAIEDENEFITWKKIGEKYLNNREYFVFNSIDETKYSEKSDSKDENNTKVVPEMESSENNCENFLLTDRDGLVDTETISWASGIKKLNQTYLIKESLDADLDSTGFFDTKKRPPVINSPRVEIYYDKKTLEKHFYGNFDDVNDSSDKGSPFPEFPKLEPLDLNNLDNDDNLDGKDTSGSERSTVSARITCRRKITPDSSQCDDPFTKKELGLETIEFEVVKNENEENPKIDNDSYNLGLTDDVDEQLETLDTCRSFKSCKSSGNDFEKLSPNKMADVETFVNDEIIGNNQVDDLDDAENRERSFSNDTNEEDHENNSENQKKAKSLEFDDFMKKDHEKSDTPRSMDNSSSSKIDCDDLLSEKMARMRLVAKNIHFGSLGANDFLILSNTDFSPRRNDNDSTDPSLPMEQKFTNDDETIDKLKITKDRQKSVADFSDDRQKSVEKSEDKEQEVNVILENTISDKDKSVKERKTSFKRCETYVIDEKPVRKKPKIENVGIEKNMDANGGFISPKNSNDSKIEKTTKIGDVFEKYVNRKFNYDSDETFANENFPRGSENFEEVDEESSSGIETSVSDVRQKAFSDSFVTREKKLFDTEVSKIPRKPEVPDFSEIEEKKKKHERLPEVQKDVSTIEEKAKAEKSSKDSRKLEDIKSDKNSKTRKQPEVENSVEIRKKLREKMKILRGNTNNLIQSIDTSGDKTMNNNSLIEIDTKFKGEVEEETIQKIDFGKLDKSIGSRKSICGYLPEIPVDRIIAKNDKSRSLKKFNDSTFSWQKATNNANSRLINLDAPKYYWETKIPFSKQSNVANFPPLVPFGGEEQRVSDRDSRAVWSHFVRQRPDFNLVLTGRTGSCIDYDPFLIAERQMNDLLSDTCSEKSLNSYSSSNPRGSSSPSLLPNYPLTHSSAFVKYADNVNGKTEIKKADKRTSLIAPPTEFDDFSSDSTETISISRELNDLDDTRSHNLNNSQENKERRKNCISNNVPGRKILLDKSKALGTKKTFDDDSLTNSDLEISPLNNGKVRRFFEKTSPKVKRSNSMRTGLKIADKKLNASDCSYKKMNSIENKRNNNCPSLSGSNVSLSSLISADIDVKRSNSLYDDIARCYQDDPEEIHSSLRSLLKTDSLSLNSPVQSNYRSHNGPISDEEFSSPDSYKRHQEHNKLSADSAYSSFNRKCSNHGRSTIDMAGHHNDDSPLRRREIDNVAANAKSKMSKFCHECGSKFPETAKFCCECGIKRLTL